MTQTIVKLLSPQYHKWYLELGIETIQITSGLITQFQLEKLTEFWLIFASTYKSSNCPHIYIYIHITLHIKHIHGVGQEINKQMVAIG